VSSWVAAIVGFLKDSGVSGTQTTSTKIMGSPYFIYLEMIPYSFYSLIIMVGAWFIVLRGISFGSMARHETIAEKDNQMFGGRPPPPNLIKKTQHADAGISDFIVPVFSLIFGIIFGMLHSGGAAGLGGELSWIEALRHSRASLGLLEGGSLGFSATVVFHCLRGRLHLRSLPKLIWEGFRLMQISMLVLCCAWTLGGMLNNDLGTGAFIADLFSQWFQPHLMPVAAFIVALIISFAVGSAWGTAAIMFPLASQLVINISGLTTPISLEALPLLVPTLAAILSGCVAGDQISPISDTTIMTATSTAMHHDDHVTTQLTYALPLVGVCALTFYTFGHLGMHIPYSSAWLVSVALAVIATVAVLEGLHLLQRKRIDKA
jgi:Na+/H+ antiporter NhaC